MGIPNLYIFSIKTLEELSEWPILAVPNIYQSLWGKLSDKIQNAHFWSFQIYTSLLGKKKSEKNWNGHFWLFQIYTSLFGKNCLKKFGMPIFGCSEFIPVFLGKIVRKNSEHPFLAIPNLYQSFWEKFGTPISCCSEFILIFLGKIVGKNSEWPFLAIPNLYQSFWQKLLEKI